MKRQTLNRMAFNNTRTTNTIFDEFPKNARFLFTTFPSTATTIQLPTDYEIYNNKNNESENENFSEYLDVPSVLLVLVLLFIIVGTVVGNLLVCVAVCMVKKLRRPYNYLLVSLAVSDLCVAILVMPVALLNELLGRWEFGPLVCDIWVSFDVLSCTASILNLCMISVDRYLAITRPLEYGVKRTPKRMFAYIAVVWVGAGFVSVPPVLILGNEHGDGNRCDVCQNFYYQIYATFASFYLPLCVMVTVYYKIFRAARRIVTEERRARAHLKKVDEGPGHTEGPAPASSSQQHQDSRAARCLSSQRCSVVEVRNGGVNTRLASSLPPPSLLLHRDAAAQVPLLSDAHPSNISRKQSEQSQGLSENSQRLNLELPSCRLSCPSPASTVTTYGSSWSLPEGSVRSPVHHLTCIPDSPGWTGELVTARQLETKGPAIGQHEDELSSVAQAAEYGPQDTNEGGQGHTKATRTRYQRMSFDGSSRNSELFMTDTNEDSDNGNSRSNSYDSNVTIDVCKSNYMKFEVSTPTQVTPSNFVGRCDPPTPIVSSSGSACTVWTRPNESAGEAAFQLDTARDTSPVVTTDVTSDSSLVRKTGFQPCEERRRHLSENVGGNNPNDSGGGDYRSVSSRAATDSVPSSNAATRKNINVDSVRTENTSSIPSACVVDPIVTNNKRLSGTQSDNSPTDKKHKQSRMRFQLAKERKASTTLGIIMSAFIICWLPFFVLALVRPFLSDPTAIPMSISSLFLWLGYANSTLNPIIYATLNKDFRKPFQEILCMRCSSLNNLMREDFYHSQFGPDTPTLSHVRVNHPGPGAQESLDHCLDLVDKEGGEQGGTGSGRLNESRM